jgi:hypothetical protein
MSTWEASKLHPLIIRDVFDQAHQVVHPQLALDEARSAFAGSQTGPSWDTGVQTIGQNNQGPDLAYGISWHI